MTHPQVRHADYSNNRS